MPESTVGEGRDASDLGLTGVQQALVEAVHATGTPTAVLVLSGRVHALPWIVENIPAVLLAWPLGEEGGAAVASVLLGDDEPGGRLPVSLPRTVGHIPSYDGPRAGGGRAAFSGDYTDSPAGPLLAFGHGLGYTTFAYEPLDVEAADTESPVVVSVTVTNTGNRSGTEVVQLFVRDDVASVARPERQLVGFARVTCDPGQSRTVTFTVHPSKLAFYDQSMRFVTEPGSFTFTSGGRATSATLGGDVREFQQRAIVATEISL
jgi:beta-glucosidase